ncbi:hypothetical protein BGZ60DRAFT_410265 [Tricladium varicosporioides]|nr:hypothetical protein BGZ60DRAFT_410265 [Hymenoscyphus varicosporioides]
MILGLQRTIKLNISPHKLPDGTLLDAFETVFGLGSPYPCIMYEEHKENHMA